MRQLARSFLLSAALLAGGAAAAQEKPDEIVVTGARNTEEQVQDFVKALTPGPSRGQLSRFEGDVCPAAAGLPPAQNAAVVERLRAVAKAVGIRVAEPGCVANAIVMVADDKDAFLSALRFRRMDYFGEMSPTEIRRVLKSPGPTAAWQLKDKVNARGVQLVVDPSLGYTTNKTTDPATRISSPGRWIFTSAALVVERSALEGLTATQFADYAAMRLLGGVDPKTLSPSSAPTILSALEAPMGSALPLTLTRWDLSFLRSFYSSPDTLYTGARRSAIAKTMTKELEKAQAAEAQR